MDIDKLFESESLDGIADNVFGVVNNSVSEVKEMQRKKVAENVQLVVNALKKIESDISSRYDSVGNALEKRIITIKDGRDGADGRDGRNGKDGKNGRDGAPGPRGADGKNGLDGADGTDGVSVTNAHIDFDGSLVISLSSGQEINVGEVVAPALAEQIKVITNGGGTSQSVIDTLASLQAQITALGTAAAYKGLWNASTNTPTLASGVGTSGNFYIVSVAGSTNLDGITNWGVGDWAIYNGTAWQRVEGGAAGNFTTVTASSLTSGRVTYAGTAGLLQDSANLTFNGTTLTANTIGAFTLGGTVAGGGNQINNVIIGTTTPLAGAFTTLSTTESIDAASFGPDLVTNGSFTGSATGWTLGTGWAYGTNNAILTLSASAEGTLSQNITVASGTSYIVTFTQTQSVAHNGGVQVAIGSYSSSVYATISSTTTANTVSLVIDVVTGGSLALTLTPTDQLSTGTVTLDDISVKAITTVPAAISLKTSASVSTVEMRNPSSASSVPTFVGYESGRCYVSGNVASFGNGSGRNLTATSNITLLGTSAGLRMTTANNIVAIGSSALQNIYSGTSSIGIGNNVMQFATNTDNNIAIGSQSMAQATSATNNVAVGYRSMRYITSGSSNVSLGSADTTPGAAVGGALAGITTGNNNTAIGTQALAGVSTTGNNTAVGYQAGYVTTGIGNQFFGYSSGSAVTSGAKNVILGSYTGSAAPISATGSNYVVLSDGDANVRAYWNGAAATFNGGLAVTGTLSSTLDATIYGLTVGRGGGAVIGNTVLGASALASNLTSTGMTAVGYVAGQDATAGDYSTYIGYLSGQHTLGAQNTAVGSYSLNNVSGTGGTGTWNAAFGRQSLYSNTSGSYNTALGSYALNGNTTANNNTAVGYQAGYSNTTASGLTAVGYQALYTANRTADAAGDSTALGYKAGFGQTTGNNNVFIGFQAGSYTTVSTTATQCIYIGNYSRGSAVGNTNETVIGTNVAGKGSNTAFIDGTSGAYNGANVTTWSTTSDQRIKKNIIDVTNGLSVITALRPVEFDYKENNKHEVGFIAQEYQQVLPDQIIQHAANEAEKEWVDYDGKVFGIQQNLVPYLVKAIQELSAKVTALENK